MALHNQATNLNTGRASLSPSVTYFAGIKAPKAPDVTLPKAKAGFNIDLSRIGDAMIAAKESETKLGIAAINMEENMRNAEKDRQLKIDLAEKEDARLREMQDKQLAMQWQIASMQNDTELLKIQKEKERKDKDHSQALASNFFIDTMRDTTTARLNNSITPEEYATRYNQALDMTRQYYPEVNMSSIGADYNKLYPGLYQANTTRVLKLEDAVQQTKTNAINETIKNDPSLSASALLDPIGTEQAVIQRAGNVKSVVDYIQIRNNPLSSEEDRQLAWRTASEAGANLAQVESVQNMYNVLSKMKGMNVRDMVYAKQAVINTTRATLSNIPGLSSNDIDYFIDQSWAQMGGDRFMEDMLNLMKQDKDVADNLLATKTNNIKLQAIGMPGLGFFMSMPGGLQSAILQNDIIQGGGISAALGDAVFGSVAVDEDGYYEYKRGLTTLATYSPQEVEKLMRLTGAETPEQAIRNIQMLQGGSAYEKVATKQIPVNGGINLVNNGIEAASGAVDGRPVTDYPVSDQVQLMKNLAQYEAAHPQSVRMAMEECEKQGINSPACNLAQVGLSLQSRLSDEEMFKLQQDVTYAKPIKPGEAFENSFIRGSLDFIKDSEVVIKTFPGDDRNIGIDYIDKGVLGAAGKINRMKRVENILNVLNSDPNLTKQMKIDYLKRMWGRDTKVIEASMLNKGLLLGTKRTYQDLIGAVTEIAAEKESEIVDALVTNSSRSLGKIVDSLLNYSDTIAKKTLKSIASKTPVAQAMTAVGAVRRVLDMPEEQRESLIPTLVRLSTHYLNSGIESFKTVGEMITKAVTTFKDNDTLPQLIDYLNTMFDEWLLGNDGGVTVELVGNND